MVNSRFKMKLQLNKVLLPVKCFYFFFFGGLSGVAPFLPVYSRQLGISNTVIGYMTSVLPLTVILAKPVFGVLADRYNKHKLIFISSMAFTGVYFFIMFIPEMVYEINLSVSKTSCMNEDSLVVEICGSQMQSCIQEEANNFNAICSLSCGYDSSPLQSVSVLSHHLFSLDTTQNCFNHSILMSNYTLDNKTDMICNNGSDMLQCMISCACDDNENQGVSATSYRFILLFCIMFLGYVSAGITISIGDTLVMDCVTACKGEFGRQRVCGTVSWGLCAFISGQLQKVASVGLDRTNFSPGFYLFLAMMATSCCSAYNIHVFSHPKQKQMFSHLLKMYTDPRLVFFSLAVFVMGFMTSAVWVFLAVYLFDMGAPPELLGFTMAVQCFGGELPIFLMSGFIVRKIGHVYSMSICLAAYAFRFFGYFFVTNPWWTLPFELTNGFTFGLFYATLIPFASSVAPKGMAATVQGSLQTMFDGLGVGIGNLVIGKMYDHYGGRNLYCILGFVTVICCVIYTVAMMLILKFGRSNLNVCTSASPEKGTEINAAKTCDSNAASGDVS